MQDKKTSDMRTQNLMEAKMKKLKWKYSNKELKDQCKRKENKYCLPCVIFCQGKFFRIAIAMNNSTLKKKLLLESGTREKAVYARVVPSPHSSDALSCVKILKEQASGGE